MRAVISLGGAVLTEAIHQERLDHYVDTFNDLADELETLIIVTGAGALKRYILSVDEFDVSEARKDLIGIAATRLQAETLAAALYANVRIPDTLQEVAELAETRDVIVLGGLLPGQSTDGVAAECAEIIGADRLIIATTVDGVYDKNPHEHDDAEKFESLTYEEMLDLVRDQESSAGSYALMDLTAAKLIQRSTLETVILDGTNVDELSKSLGDGHDGTMIAE